MDGNHDGVDNPDDVDGNVVNVVQNKNNNTYVQNKNNNNNTDTEDDSLDGELVVGGCAAGRTGW